VSINQFFATLESKTYWSSLYFPVRSLMVGNESFVFSSISIFRISEKAADILLFISVANALSASSSFTSFTFGL